MVWVGRHVRRSVVQPPAQSPLAMRTKFLGALSSKVLKISKDGACTTSLPVQPLLVLMGKSSSSYPVGRSLVSIYAHSLLSSHRVLL